MFINREYSLEYFKSSVFSEDFIILTSNVNNDRSQVLIESFPNAKYVDISYTINKNSDDMLSDSFEINTNYKSCLHQKQYTSLYQDLRNFVEQLYSESKSIIIDISSVHLRFLGALLATMTEWKWSSVICAYTETTAYPRYKEIKPIADESIYIPVGFDLNSSFWGYNEIPNLKTITNDRENYVWIVFLGFEGKRSAAVYTEISDDTNITIPVITMPSVKPGWSNYTFDANQRLFESANIHSSDFRYTDALDPFATYNFLEEIKEEHPTKHLVISPLGTRPVSLGALLYALNHEESELYFDTPKESCSKIISSGKIHIYDILTLISENNALTEENDG